MTAYWYGALNQKTYPLVGDIDDCWVVASIWAVRYQTKQSRHLPSARKFRIAAGNPDDPHRSDGGNRNQIDRACNRLWPTVRSINFASRDWQRFTAYLRAGASASVATSSRLLPHNYGFRGPHQVAVVYRHGEYRVMNPLQRAGTAPRVISEAALKRSVLGLNGWVQAVIFPKVTLGYFKKSHSTVLRPFAKFGRTTRGTFIRRVGMTRGFAALALPPRKMRVKGRTRTVCQIMTGGRAGWFVRTDLKDATWTK